MNKFNVLSCILLLAHFSSCSHKKVKTDTAPAPTAAIDPNSELSLPSCEGKTCPSNTANDYLNHVALPKISSSHVVQECFLNNPKTKPREKTAGNLSFKFEIKLIAQGSQVVVDRVYLSNLTNIPEWTKPCLMEKYSELIFPSFGDRDLKTTTAFGMVNMSWPKSKIN